MKKSAFVILLAVLLCSSVCLSGCSLFYVGSTIDDALDDLDIDKVTGKIDDYLDDIDEIDDDEDVIAPGVTYNNSYINEYFDLKVTLDPKYRFNTREEIQGINNITGDLLGDDSYANMFEEALETGGVFIDMYAATEDYFDTVNFAVEKVNAGSLLLSEKGYAEAAVEQTKTSLEQIGITVTSAEIEEIVMAEDVHSAIRIKGLAADGVTGLEQLLVIDKEGMYFGLLCVTSYTGADLNAIIAGVTEE